MQALRGLALSLSLSQKEKKKEEEEQAVGKSLVTVSDPRPPLLWMTAATPRAGGSRCLKGIRMLHLGYYYY